MATLVRPLAYISLALLFLVLLLLIQLGPLVGFFAENLAVNLMILVVFIFAIALSFWRLASLAFEIDWLARVRNLTQTSQVGALSAPQTLKRLALLQSFAQIWQQFLDGDRGLSVPMAATLVESAQARVDDRRELSRYLITALVILGLLGTFWGLLGALVSMREALGNLDSGQDFFAGLSSSLSGPLENMGTAFSSSLFGLGASLFFGFVELQTARAHHAFVEDFESWITGSIGNEPTALNATMHKGQEAGASLGARAFQSIAPDNSSSQVEALGHLIRRGQQDSLVLNNNLVTLLDQLTRVADKLTADQVIHEKILAIQADQNNLAAAMADLTAALKAPGLAIVQAQGPSEDTPEEPADLNQPDLTSGETKEVSDQTQNPQKLREPSP